MKKYLCKITKYFSKTYLANTITSSRIIGACFILCITPYQYTSGKYWALLIYILLAFSDKIDGWIAKSKYGQITTLGKILDPIADKILVLIYLAIIEMRQITAGPVAILFLRDHLSSLLRQYALSRGIVMQAKMSGKIKTAYAFTLAFILLARAPIIHENDLPIYHKFPVILLQDVVAYIIQWPDWIIRTGIYALMAICVYSGIDYMLSIVKRFHRYS